MIGHERWERTSCTPSAACCGLTVSQPVPFRGGPSWRVAGRRCKMVISIERANRRTSERTTRRGNELGPDLSRRCQAALPWVPVTTGGQNRRCIRKRQLNRRPRCSGKNQIEDREMREGRRRGKMKGPCRMRVEVGRPGNAGWAACFAPRPSGLSATADFVPGVRLLQSLVNLGHCLWQVERAGRQTDWIGSSVGNLKWPGYGVTEPGRHAHSRPEKPGTATWNRSAAQPKQPWKGQEKPGIGWDYAVIVDTIRSRIEYLGSHC